MASGVAQVPEHVEKNGFTSGHWDSLEQLVLDNQRLFKLDGLIDNSLLNWTKTLPSSGNLGTCVNGGQYDLV